MEGGSAGRAAAAAEAAEEQGARVGDEFAVLGGDGMGEATVVGVSGAAREEAEEGERRGEEG